MALRLPCGLVSADAEAAYCRVGQPLSPVRTPSGRYFVSLMVDVPPAPLPETGQSVGIDFGISRLATLSNGARVANPKYLNRYQRRLARDENAARTIWTVGQTVVAHGDGVSAA